MGDKFAITLNDSKKAIIVTDDYVVFRIVKRDILLDEYLFMLFNRPEFDRYVRFNSWGSATEMFVWENMQDVVFSIPDIDQQRHYTSVFIALKENLAIYQSRIDDLKTVCDGYIEKLRREYKDSDQYVRIGDYIVERNEVNDNGEITLEQGINIQKQFITPQRSNSNLLGRKIVRKGDIAFCTQLNNENVAIALREEEDCVVSSVYDSIYIKDESVLLPKYLMLWLVRPEFGRYVYTMSTGSAYEFLSIDDLSNYKIPLPSLELQQSIVNIYDCLNERKSIAAILRDTIKELCPILIKGSLQNDN